jgi:uncharacterized membrane protein YgaE (UPF0421/DUF939 family)
MRARLDERLRDVRRSLWPLLQTAAAGAISWELARQIPGHDRPLFAPIVAIVAMGISTGRRARQAVRLVLGAVLGIVVADVLVRLFGDGAVQLAVILFVSLALARLLSAEPIFVTQAGISALLVVAVERQTQGLAPERLIDAAIGGSVALVMSLLLFPVDPVIAFRRAAKPLIADLETTLRETAAALRDGDAERAVRARSRRLDRAQLDDAVALGLEAVRVSPRRFRLRGRIAAYAEIAHRLASVVRGTRVIAGSATRVLRARNAPAPELAAPVETLAGAIAALGAWLDGADAERTAVRDDALEAARQAAHTSTHELGGGTIVHLVQSIAVDLLRATGLDGADVQQRLAEAQRAAPPESRLPVA